jgi:hypothetical protein
MVDRTTDTNDAGAGPGRWRRVILNRWLLGGVLATAVYALIGYFLAPWMLKRYVTDYAAERLKRKASIAEVRVNPFLFTLEVKNFIFQEKDSRPIIGFGRLFVDFELSSLFRWAWTFADIRIERPSLSAEIRPNGRLNFADLADSFPKSGNPAPTGRRLPRLLLQHAEIVDGSFTFSDQSNPTPASETFSPLNLKFNKISTLPERKGPYAIEADLPGGGTAGWRGEISLHPIFSAGKICITGFKPATAWKFVQDKLNLAEPEGEMNFSTRYRFDYRKGTPQLILQDAVFTLKNLVLTEKRKRTPLLALKAIEASGMRFDLQKRNLKVPAIAVRDGRITAAVDEKGMLDWQRLVALKASENAKAPVPDSPTSGSPPWRLELGAANIDDVALDFTDRSRAVPLAIAVAGLDMALNASAEIGAGPVRAMVDGLKVKLGGISLSEAGDANPLLSLDALALADGQIDVGGRAITIAQVAAAGGKTSVVRDKDGRIRLLDLLRPGDQGLIRRKATQVRKAAEIEGRPWSFRLGTFKLDNFGVALQDRTFTQDIVYNFKDIRVSLKNLTNDKKTPIIFDTALDVEQGGMADVSGQVSQTGDHLNARVKLTGLSIKPLHPVITRFTSLQLESGNLSASIRVDYLSRKSGPQLSAAGSLGMSRLRLNEANTGKRFLEWKEMSANGLQFGLSPDRLRIDTVNLLEPGAKVVIFKNRSVNLAIALKSANAAGTGTNPQSGGIPAVTLSKSPTLFPVKIGRIRVEKGVVDFADLSLVLPFSTRITDFSGSITGISSQRKSRAEISFNGRVAPYGLSKVTGTLSPFTPKAFTDVSVRFRNVEMKPFTPYSATFAGRKIAAGKLNLDLQYKVRNSELSGENKVVLDKFTLGERVKSPGAVNLPLDLAVALLTDADGKIDVAVPVHGNMDNPEFKYGHVIWQAFVNLITKVATAPFRALAGIFGGKGRKMDAIAFDPGSARLLPPEQEKLKAVSEALKKRPQLELVVEGRFDPEADGEALRTERARRGLAKQTGIKLAAGEKPGAIAFDRAETQKALEKLLVMRSGDNAIADFATAYEKATGKQAKRANFAMSFIGMASSDIAFYQAMFKELVKLEPLSDTDLKDLAKMRADAIKNELTATHGLSDRRVISGPPGPVEKASMEGVNTSLKLDVIKPAG